ncbi:MAG TPA: hypothetical protein VHN80_01260, partial [Kineosporiaceae bacterium]|nr:hypothetical protein [Kineosporiaceae bacterium]
MKLNGPIVTLLAGVVVGAGLLVANVTLTGNDDAAKVAAPAASAAASTSASPAASASPSVAVKVSAPAAVGTVATYAGHVYNGNVKGGSLSVVIKGDTAIAYLCDGKIEAWLWGKVSGTSLSLKNKDGATLVATRGGGKVTGRITAAGGTWTFALPSVKKPSG